VTRARVMIMLGSPDYFAPDCGAAECEIKPALKAHQKGEIIILWFRVRDHSFSICPVRDIMAVTGPGAVPLETLSPPEQDAALRKIHQEVLNILGLAAKSPQTAIETPAMNTQQKRFKIALSFPGEHRAFVEQVASHLASHVGRDRVLYDRYYEAELARPDLDIYLQRLYHDESELIAMFLCADYERKEWCGLEWRALRDLIKRRQASTIMPFRSDNTEIPGLFSTDGYVWIGNRSPLEVADLILQRMQGNTATPGITSPPAPAATSSTSTPAQPPSTAPAGALQIWREKLDFLQQQEAIIADPAQKFALRKQIEETKEKIRELGG
jgi:hypothetical protein